MAKKFLLYIHDPRFEDEEHKSGLVNSLLNDHYQKPLPEPRKKADIIDFALCSHFAAKGFCKFSKCPHSRI